MEFELLRPAEWVARSGLAVGGLHFTNIEELELRGFARVTAIEACPPLAGGDGAVVTGRYITRGAGKLVRVRLDDGSDLVGTAQHPIWSESRRAWTPLGELLPGEHLRGRSGPLAVSSVEPLPGTADVYNLEIHGQHVYAITPAGVLVHNTGLDDCAGSAARGNAPRRVEAMMRSQKIAPDILDKGVHFNVGRIELRAVPDHLGGVAFRPVHPGMAKKLSKYMDAAYQQAFDAMQYPVFRQWLSRHAQMGFTLAASTGSAKALEFKFLLKALERIQ